MLKSKEFIEICVAVVVFALSVMGVIHTTTFAAPAAAYFPAAVLAGSALLCVAWVVQAATRLRNNPDILSVSRGAVGRVAACLILIAIYAVIIQYIGFLTSTLLFIPASTFITHYRNWKATALTTVGIMILLYVVFFHVLKTPMPPEALAVLIGG